MVKTLRDVISVGTFLSFSELRGKFKLQGWMYFHCLQLRHAARAQFPNPLSLTMDPIEELLDQVSLLKPLSALYLAFLSVDSPGMERLWVMWKADLFALDREDCLEDSTKLLISSFE